MPLGWMKCLALRWVLIAAVLLVAGVPLSWPPSALFWLLGGYPVGDGLCGLSAPGGAVGAGELGGSVLHLAAQAFAVGVLGDDGCGILFF